MRRQRMRRKDFVREASKTFPVARERMHLLREPQPDSNSLFVAGTKHPVSEVLYGEFEYLQDFEYLDRATQDRGSAILAVFGRERSEKENLACHDKLKNLLCERGLRYHEVYGMYQQVPCDAEAHDFDSGLVHEDLLLCHVPCNPDSVSDFESFSAWMLEIVTHKLETAALLLVASIHDRPCTGNTKPASISIWPAVMSRRVLNSLSSHGCRGPRKQPSYPVGPSANRRLPMTPC